MSVKEVTLKHTFLDLFSTENLSCSHPQVVGIFSGLTTFLKRIVLLNQGHRKHLSLQHKGCSSQSSSSGSPS